VSDAPDHLLALTPDAPPVEADHDGHATTAEESAASEMSDALDPPPTDQGEED